MVSTKEKDSRQVKALTEKERVGIQRFFSSILSEMNKHGLTQNVKLLKKAYSQALSAHGEMRRKTGEPYIMHPLQVAKILAECGHESEMVAAAILHDIMEECNVTKQEIEAEFGVNIADIVDAVTSVSTMFAPGEFMSKNDLGTLSDVKFLNESARVKKAVYIKCADRIHNLQTIGIFPVEQQIAKAYHTRNIIIPAAKKLHIHNLVNILSDLCLKIENLEQYEEVKDSYYGILRKNQDTIRGRCGLIEETRRMVFEDGRFGRFVVDLDFNERYIDSIYTELIGKLNSENDLKLLLRKQMFSVFDIYFISSDNYVGTPDNLFFLYYDRLHQSTYKFTIIGHHEDDYETYYILKDRYENTYRLFVQSETEHLEFIYGQIVSDQQYEGTYYVNTAEPDAPQQKMIQVFKKDGTPMEIIEGATVLDFAFAIDPNMGICTKYAFINGGSSQMPIYTKLKSGDKIEIICDYDKDDQINDIPHATIRWFEYLHSREAIKALSRWLEKHMDSAVPSMLVYDAEDNKEYEIDMAATVLDFAFLVSEKVGLHVKKAYINESHIPTELDVTLRYGDKVRFEYDINDKETPVFTWLSIVKTKFAKDRLIAYFNNRFTD